VACNLWRSASRRGTGLVIAEAGLRCHGLAGFDEELTGQVAVAPGSDQHHRQPVACCETQS
jgi:hypothetical protein